MQWEDSEAKSVVGMRDAMMSSLFEKISEL